MHPEFSGVNNIVLGKYNYYRCKDVCNKHYNS